MADWMDNQISEAEEQDDEQNVTSRSAKEFTNRIHTMIGTESIERLTLDVLEERIHEVENVEVLSAAFEAEERDEARELYREQLAELGELDAIESDETEEPSSDDVETDAEADADADGDEEETASEPDAEPEPEPEPESEPESGDSSDGQDDDTETDESADETPDDPFSVPDDEQDEDEEESADEADSDDESADTGTDEKVEPETPETPDVAPTATADTETTKTDGGADTAASEHTANIDVKSIAPDVITADEAAERQRRFTMMVWSDPGMGKTHFACSAPDPVVIIDTEGKADEVAGKFRGDGRVPESPFLFQPTDYDEAMDALEKALDILDEYRTQADMTGTIVVDSMSVMWGWSQQKYVDKYYPGKDAEEVEFNSAIGGGQSDWKQIKRYHNVKFRQPMIDSPYHLVWTAMRQDDYEERMKGNRDADKPAGEKENPYKVDEVLRIREGGDGAPVGVLNKSGKIKHRYAGLRYPTFDKHRDMVDAILDAENGSRSIQAVASKNDVRVHEGNPEFGDDDE